MFPEPTLRNRYGLAEEILMDARDWNSEKRDGVHSSTKGLYWHQLITVALN